MSILLFSCPPSQYIKLKQSEEEYRDKFESYIEPVKNDIMRESSSMFLRDHKLRVHGSCYYLEFG